MQHAAPRPAAQPLARPGRHKLDGAVVPASGLNPQGCGLNPQGCSLEHVGLQTLARRAAAATERLLEQEANREDAFVRPSTKSAHAMRRTAAVAARSSGGVCGDVRTVRELYSSEPRLSGRGQRHQGLRRHLREVLGLHYRSRAGQYRPV